MPKVHTGTGVPVPVNVPHWAREKEWNAQLVEQARLFGEMDATLENELEAEVEARVVMDWKETDWDAAWDAREARNTARR